MVRGEAANTNVIVFGLTGHGSKDVPFHMFVFGEIITDKATVKSVSSLEFRLMMMYA
jgi:hypothetical protein